MYGIKYNSRKQKIISLLLHYVIILISYWLMFAGGIEIISKTFSFPIQQGDVTRRWIILICEGFFFVRFAVNELIFMDRYVPWSESLTLVLWLFIAYTTFSFTGGTNPSTFGNTEVAGIIIYFIGSFLNGHSEYLRYKWKKLPENKNHLYTGGLFKLSRHINYFGETVIFIGFAMITRSIWSYVLPASLFVLFVYVNIPMLENYLKRTYGNEFDEYSQHSYKYIPFVY